MSESPLENLYSLDHLTPTNFEELCFDLLKAIGCVDVDWRKGTNTEHSPADGGRDIECSFENTDPDVLNFDRNGLLNVNIIKMQFQLRSCKEL